MLHLQKLTKTTCSTKKRILMEAARLFAIHGYEAISVKDITSAVFVTPASLYNYYSSKKGILDDIFSMCAASMEESFEKLTQANSQAASLDDVLYNILSGSDSNNQKLTIYGLAIAIHEQFSSEKAQDFLYEYLHNDGKEKVKGQLLMAIDNGLAPHFDVDAVASLIIDYMIANCFLQLGILEGFYPQSMGDKRYKTLCSFISQAVNSTVILPPAKTG